MKKMVRLNVPILITITAIVLMQRAQALEAVNNFGKPQQNNQAQLATSLITDSAVNPLTGQPQSFEQIQRATEQAQMITKYLDEKVKQAQALEKLKTQSMPGSATVGDETAARMLEVERSKPKKALEKREIRKTRLKKFDMPSPVISMPKVPNLVSKGYVEIDGQAIPIQHNSAPVNRIVASDKPALFNMPPTPSRQAQNEVFVPSPFPTGDMTQMPQQSEAVPPINMGSQPVTIPNPNFADVNATHGAF